MTKDFTVRNGMPVFISPIATQPIANARELQPAGEKEHTAERRDRAKPRGAAQREQVQAAAEDRHASREKARRGFQTVKQRGISLQQADTDQRQRMEHVV